uniref:Uncharacterized protein n=1 Tax=Rhizophora mucronata TaxID=61149 RepID=A0A2P2NQE9_RHIMU
MKIKRNERIMGYHCKSKRKYAFLSQEEKQERKHYALQAFCFSSSGFDSSL